MICFGSCSFSASRRELSVAGQRKSLEPRVFDLLTYLVEHRDRVVSKAELVAKLWCDEPISDNVIARSVMKLRQALEDPGGEQGWIRTYPRVGYRFVGQVRHASDDDRVLAGRAGEAWSPAVPGPDLLDGAPLRMGLLPFENLSGREDLDWVRLGVAAFVAQALDAVEGLSVAPASEVESVLAGLTWEQSASQASLVQQRSGLQCLIRTQVVRRSGQLALEYDALGPLGVGLSGRISSGGIMTLAERLASRIERHLFPSRQAAVGFESSDAVASASFARAMQAMAEERWASAEKLLKVVLDIDPANFAARLQHVNVVAALYDPQCVPLAEELLHEALDRGDARWVASAHHALAFALLNTGREAGEVRHHMEQALQVAAPFGHADWVLRMRLTQARHFQQQRSYAWAHRLYSQAAEGCEAVGNRIMLAKILNNRAVIDAMTGNLLGAREWLADAMKVSQDLRLESNVVASNSNLAMVNVQLGLLQRAAAMNESIVPALAALQDPRMAAGVALTACCVHAELSDLEAMDRVLRVVRSRADAERPALQPFLLMSSGLRAAVAGDLQEAATQMRRAIALVRDEGDNFMVDQWLPMLLRVQMQTGQEALIQQALEALAPADSLAKDDRLQGMACHAMAVIAYSQRRRERARVLLVEAVQLLPMGVWSAHARLDAAWLQLDEVADATAARRLLRDIQPWLQEHPAGWLVAARLACAERDFALAADMQARRLVLPGRPGRAVDARLLAHYRLGAQAAPETLPRPLQLPSVL